jgi:hypothetical protein
MTTCSTNVCGTGGWTGPLPGDPDNNSVLTAAPAFGGIDVSWTYPTVNPEAVAYVKLFRGVSADFNTAFQIAVVSADQYFDKINGNLRYYYWIQIVSVNGTVGSLIGPASAVAKPIIEDVIAMLTGQIDAGVLAQSLRAEVDKITLNYQDLLDEVDQRIAANTAYSNLIAQVQSGITQALTLVNTEITQRRDGDSALAAQINTVASVSNAAAAAVITEQNARIAGDSANASSITTLNSQVNDSLTGLPATRSILLNNYYTKTGTDSAISSATTNLVSTTGLNSILTGYATAAALSSEATTRSNADTALSSSITTLTSTVNGNQSALQTNYYTKTAADSAISAAVNTATTTWNSNLASAQTTLQTNITTVNNKVTAIGALYTATVTVNGLVGGFGIYNNGASVEAGFDVDTFWVGKTSTDKRKPFIISGGQTYIDEAAINSLTFNKLRDSTGSVIVADNKLTAANINGTNLSVVNGTFSGVLNGATGKFSGEISAGSIKLTEVGGASFTYSTPGVYTVYTLPFTGTVRFNMCGAGGGGAGGQGNTEARTDVSGYAGLPGTSVYMTITNVPAGSVVSVSIGTGGTGGVAGGLGTAGTASILTITPPGGSPVTWANCAGGAAGGQFRSNLNPDSGLTGVQPVRTDWHNFHLGDYGDGAGGRSGQNGLAISDIAGSIGGGGGFYGKESDLVWGNIPASRRGELSGTAGIRGGGGGGGCATRFRAFSNGSMIGLRSAVYGWEDGNPESNGGKGGDGYAFIEIFDPNSVVLKGDFDVYAESINQRFSLLETFGASNFPSDGTGVWSHITPTDVDGIPTEYLWNSQYTARGAYGVGTSKVITNLCVTKKMRFQAYMYYYSNTDDTYNLALRVNGTNIAVSATRSGWSGTLLYDFGTFDVDVSSKATVQFSGSVLTGSNWDILFLTSAYLRFVGFV